MPKYFPYKVCGYYLYYTEHCILEACMHMPVIQNSQKPVLQNFLFELTVQQLYKIVEP